MSHSNALEKSKSLIEQYDMLETGDRVVVGLSGGADSVTLLNVLFELKNQYSLKLIAAHVEHGIRGEEALRDAEFCKKICDELGVEFYVLHIDVPAIAKERGVSEEVAGRDVRYEFFAGLAGDRGKIATAHNAQDTAETLILNLCRGTGLKGLTGIPPVRTMSVGKTCSHDSGEIPVIRPLLLCTREEIEEYISSNNLSYVTDSTNLEDEYTRNRVRHNIIPELVSVNENAINNITRCITTIREDSNYLEDKASSLIAEAARTAAYDVPTLLAADKPILARAISRIVYDACGAYPEKVHVDKTIDMMKIGRTDQVQVPTGAFVRVEKGELKVIK